jgi:asparagine synthase (glutamine-hydrolysing)
MARNAISGADIAANRCQYQANCVSTLRLGALAGRSWGDIVNLMCGIAGWIGRRAAAPADADLVTMLQSISHRGPDGDGTFYQSFDLGESRVAMGHKRLAILDLAGGAQPMASGDDRIVFNGEIYNFVSLRAELAAAGHQFATRSDTEVVLKAYQEWGARFVERLRGMFALAIWDAQRAILLLARDRFGKKPLFFANRNGALLFASEIKALLPQVGREIQPEALEAYFAYRYVPGPLTFFRGIEKLPPGTIGIWDRGEFRTKTYWQPPDALPRVPWRGGNPVAALRGALDEAVALRMVADVPFGAFLSGGLDSSMVVALMARHSANPVETFAVGFDEPGYSELDEAALVAHHVGTRHHPLTVTAADFPEVLPLLIRARDAPVPEPSDIALYRLAMYASKSVKMVLTGEGADEILGGYPKHRAERLSRAYRQLVPDAVHRRLILPLAGRSPVAARRLRIALTAMGLRDEPARFAQWFGALSPEARRGLLALPVSPFLPPAVSGTTALRRLFHFDQSSWLPDNLLERGDRVTMAASIEARVPFLDQCLVELVSSLPDRDRLGKSLLRRVAVDLVPAHTIRRRKVGFSAPTGRWLRGGLKSFLLDTLTGPSSRTHRYYDASALNRLLNDHMSGRADHDKLLWTLLSLEIFHREYAL